MRSKDDYELFFKYKKNGLTNTEISKISGIPRTTLNYWKLNKIKKEKPKFKHFDNNDWIKSYNYLLGMYLGDGYIIKIRRVFSLKIYNDIKYDKLNEYIYNTIKKIFPLNNIMKQKRQNHIITYVYSNTIPELFPQLGKGLKKNRKIKLYDWQKNIIDYKYLFSGLLHSDGSIYYDRKYKMCCFGNTSKDILKIFKLCCNKLNLKFTETNNKIFIRNRSNIKWIDENIGDKNIIKI
jgi:hypothetical protein